MPLYSAIIGGITVITTNKDDEKIKNSDILILYPKLILKKKVSFSLFRFIRMQNRREYSHLFKGIENREKLKVLN